MNRAVVFLIGGAVSAAVTAALVAPIAFGAGELLNSEVKKGMVPVACGNPATIQQVSTKTPKVPGFSTVQVRNAATIVQAGQNMRVPSRGWVIAVATAMQETDLRNLASDSRRYPTVSRLSQALPHDGLGHDHDSVGLFQQRPNEGDGSWGPVRDLMQPAKAASKFYTALLKVDGWQSMPLTRAAQRVQRSSYPDAYAKRETSASGLVDRLSGNAAQAPADVKTPTTSCAAHTDQVAASGWVRPVSGEIGEQWHAAYRKGRQHEGVDLGAARGTPIKAAAAGTVIWMECDRAKEDGYNCNRDGSTSTRGCGWYVDIRHAGGVITRYCHQLRRPLVKVGDKVVAGQQIGVVGTSGHSSGPHLHFEVHLGSRGSSSTVDPVKFMASHGAPLGTGTKT